MGFGTGLSGLNAASKNLDVIGHNIANGNTTGMKAGRAEFSEMYASALGAAGGSNGGIGVNVATVATQFTQGNLKVTGNNLDMAINGDGFYKVAMTDGSTAYTRSGEFKLDKNGYLITNAGARVQGYMPSAIGGTIPTGVTSDLMLPTSKSIEPKETIGATSADPAISITANLPSKAAVLTGAESAQLTADVSGTTDLSDKFKKYATSINVYDKEGNTIPVRLSFNHKTVAPGLSTWNVVASVVDNTVDPAKWTHFDLKDVAFDQFGKVLPTPVLDKLTIANGDIGTGIPSNDPNLGPLALGIGTAAAPLLTQFDSDFVVNELSQTGYGAGELTNIAVNEQGIIKASYSNGKNLDAGQVALTRFRNVQGLNTLNGGYFLESANSGAPVDGQPMTGKFGSVRSGSLEESNVDMTAELVNMIVAQRSYQANAQTIKTQDQVLSTLVNLR